MEEAVEEDFFENGLFHVLIMEDGSAPVFTSELMKELLIDYPDLLEEFLNEPDQDDIVVLRDYLEIVDWLETEYQE